MCQRMWGRRWILAAIQCKKCRRKILCRLSVSWPLNDVKVLLQKSCHQLRLAWAAVEQGGSVAQEPWRVCWGSDLQQVFLFSVNLTCSSVWGTPSSWPIQLLHALSCSTETLLDLDWSALAGRILRLCECLPWVSSRTNKSFQVQWNKVWRADAEDGRSSSHGATTGALSLAAVNVSNTLDWVQLLPWHVHLNVSKCFPLKLLF